MTTLIEAKVGKFLSLSFAHNVFEVLKNCGQELSEQVDLLKKDVLDFRGHRELSERMLSLHLVIRESSTQIEARECEPLVTKSVLKEAED